MFIVNDVLIYFHLQSNKSDLSTMNAGTQKLKTREKPLPIEETENPLPIAVLQNIYNYMIKNCLYMLYTVNLCKL